METRAALQGEARTPQPERSPDHRSWRKAQAAAKTQYTKKKKKEPVDAVTGFSVPPLHHLPHGSILTATAERPLPMQRAHSHVITANTTKAKKRHH